MEITEQRLADYGGWQAMKVAKDYVKLGQVNEAKRDERGFHGLVGSGKSAFKASLLINAKGQVEGKCFCAEARRGMICAHELAVALQVIRGAEQKTEKQKQEIRTSGVARPTATSDATSAPKALEIPPAPVGDYHVVIMLSQLDRLKAGGTVPVFFRYEQQKDKAVQQTLWEWLYKNGIKGSAGVRLTAEELAELAPILREYHSVHDGESGVKITRKIFFISHLSQLDGFESAKSKDNILFKLHGWKLTIHKVINLLQLNRGTEVCLMSLPKLANLDLALLPSGLLISQREIVTNLDGYQQVFGSVKTWWNNLKINPFNYDLILELDGGARRVSADIAVFINQEKINLLKIQNLNKFPIQDENDNNIFYVRDLNTESRAWERCLAAGFKEARDAHFEMVGEREVMRFLSTELPRLKQTFRVIEGERFQSLARSVAVIRPQVHMKKLAGDDAGTRTGMDWLNLEVAYESDNGIRIPRNEVLRLIRSGQRSGNTANGKRFVLDIEGCENLEDTLQDLNTQLQAGGQGLAIQRRQVGVLTEFAGKDLPSMEAIQPMEDETLGVKLGELGNRLRDYQREGVRWLERLGRGMAGGLLADEMGLGKTVQTLATVKLLSGQTDEKTGRNMPALVVCPTSLLGNWADEARKFVPELRVHISHDTGRHEHLANLTEFDIIFTSYQLVARDLEMLHTIQFSVVVLDEASYIRNADTVTSKAVRQLKAKAYFALTGTPVENSVKDLWSIFEFTLPGYLPSRESFHEKYVKKLTQTDSTQAKAAMERLRRLIKPYILRRTKRDVVKELPEKMERVVWCELSSVQRELYTRLLEEGREEIRQAKRKAGQGSARMTMFTILLRLRQVCNDVRLTGVNHSVADSSGKWPQFDEMITELIEGDHRALVFSQFVGMLKLVRERLDERGLPYCYLDGSTRDRSAQVEAFQAAGEKRFFLISLKAGGYGLNLTAADHVLLMDPWWNPAVEAQAIDRAHRIGQGRPVTAERFITRGTVEEKILNLQAKKRSVMEMAMEEDATILAGLSDDELEEMILS